MPERPCKVLIVDDCHEDQAMVQLVLDEAPKRHWTFLCEEKATHALERLAVETDVDCILLDFQLPDMNGLQFIKALVARFGPLRFPVVMLTGSGRTSVAVEALKAGAQDYVSKDLIRTDALLRAMDSAIDRVRLLREREDQRKELEATNQRLRLLEAAVASTTESVLITDAELDPPGPNIIFTNEAFTRMTGYSGKEVLGKTPRILQGPLTDRSELARLRTELQAGRTFSGRTTNYRKNGEGFVIDWNIAPISNKDGKTTHFVAVQRDATEKHKSEQELRDSEERLELALRGADLGLWDWNLITGEVTYDHRWAQMLGYEKTDIESSYKGWASLVHPDDLPGAEQAIRNHVEGESPTYEAEFRMLCRTGEWRWISARGKVLHQLTDGCVHRAVGTHRDITERKEAEIALRRSNEDLQQFAHAISHDIQEPLRMIGVFAELLERRIHRELDPDSQEFLETIYRNAQKATQLVKDLLAYARAGASIQDSMGETCSLDEVLTAVLSSRRHQVDDSGMIIERQPLPTVYGNRAQFGQVLENLIDNAIKYRDPKRSLRLSIAAEANEGQWRISIRDNGIGFDQHQSEMVFGVFTRLHSISRPGSGLGLAICKRIVERHGGKIWAESVPDVGSTFFLTLPCTARAASAGD